MIKVDKLECKAVTSALLTGDFFASQEPLIHNLWFKNGKIRMSGMKKRK